jgi:hypothetical protein
MNGKNKIAEALQSAFTRVDTILPGEKKTKKMCNDESQNGL